MLAFYVNFLGMKLLAIEEVPAYNFDLYFLAFATDDKEEVPPVSEDLKSPENREWLYQVRMIITVSFLLITENSRHISASLHDPRDSALSFQTHQ